MPQNNNAHKPSGSDDGTWHISWKLTNHNLSVLIF